MLSLTLLACLLTTFTTALKFDLYAHPANSNNGKCIRNFVARDQLVVVTATVSGNRGDGQQVNLHIHDYYGNDYGRPRDVAGENRYAFTSHEDAPFDVCFENVIMTGISGMAYKSVEL